jgi:hypothetical protein
LKAAPQAAFSFFSPGRKNRMIRVFAALRIRPCGRRSCAG